MKQKKKSRFLVILLLIAGLLFACSPPVERPENVDRFQQRVQRMRLVTNMHLATIKLGEFRNGKQRNRAAGVILRQDKDSTLLLTAGHVARNVERAGVGAASLTGTPCHAEVVAKSDRYDLALLRADCRMPGIQVKLATRPVELSEPVYMLGHPLGEPYTLTKGIVSSTQRNFDLGVKGKFFVQVDAIGLIGSSGGPLFNHRGELVGITSGGPLAPVWTPWGPDHMRRVMVPSMALCVPLQHIKNFLAKQEVL
jgi:S1-C subfamily serine protease